MHIMAGLDNPTEGRAWIGDTEITGLGDLDLTILRRRRVGFVFQAFNLVPTLTALGNIMLPFELDGRRPSAIERARIDGFIDTLGLGPRLGHRPHQLSGGQQQRVAIARALATAPDLVFADEPTGNLDSATGREVLRLLAAASREHRQSIAMVTHDAVAASHADRVLFLGDGRIVADHPPSERRGDLGLHARRRGLRMSAVAAVVPQTVATGPRLGWLRDRGMGASILVAALSAAFGVVLVETTAYIGAVLQADPFIGDSETLAFVVTLLSVLLTAVAMYVAAIVTANTFSTIVAGRTRQIALMRMIGASARSQRAEVGRQGLVVGVIGALIGALVGLLAAAVGVQIGGLLIGNAPDFTIVQPFIILPVAGVALTTWMAAWVGSRRVLAVTPLQAIGGAVERSHDQVSAKQGRHLGAWVLVITGALLLGGGVLFGLASPLGVVVAFVGGVLSFTGLATGAVLFMPPVLRPVGRMFGSSATARLAAENALRYPERSSRMAIGVVMGVTLVTMFAVALESAKTLMTRQFTEEVPADFFAPVDAFATIMMVLVAVSAVIAAVGLVNLLTIGVVQRRRELGLLRAIGLSGAQVRRMVLLEATHITVAATVTGLVLGVVYGWIAAQSLLGSVPTLPDFTPAGLVAPQVPWIPVAAVVVATAVLTLIAAAAPTRLATRVVPVEALAAD